MTRQEASRKACDKSLETRSTWIVAELDENPGMYVAVPFAAYVDDVDMGETMRDAVEEWYNGKFVEQE